VTAVEFHTGVADPLGFACRLLRKAYQRQTRLVVTAPPPVLAALDRELWTFAERDFIPHLRWTPAVADATAARTPIWLIDGTLPASAPPVLVNVGAPVPAEPARLQRIIEVIGNDADALQAGRERWRTYLAAGLSPVRHPPAAASPQ
jgi:DNA polymerase III subunit chi